MLELDWKRIANGPIGFSLLAGHRFFNPFESKYRSSAPGATADVFLWLTPQISLAATSNFYVHGVLPNGFETEKKSISSVSLGGYLNMEYMGLLDLIGIGFDFKTEYLYYFSDLDDKTHQINLRARAFSRPFPTDRFAISLSGDLTWASGNLMNRGSVSLVELSGRSAWQSGIFFPVNIFKISGGANYYIGLEPGFLIGNGRRRQSGVQKSRHWNFPGPDLPGGFSGFRVLLFPVSVQHKREETALQLFVYQPAVYTGTGYGLVSG